MAKSSHRKPNKTKHPPKSDQPAKPVKSHSLNREWVLGFFLFAAVFAAYQPAWNGKPIWDDDRHITKPELRSVDGLARIWTYIGVTQQYYPLTHTVFWIEYRLWGGSTLGYHLVNILLHFFSALLLVRVLRRLAVPGAWFIAAIFALHPAAGRVGGMDHGAEKHLVGALFLRDRARVPEI